MRENFLPLRNVYLCRYLQRDLYPHCNFVSKLTVDELFPPNYVWHVQDPKGPWEGDDEVKVDDLMNPHKSVFLKMIMRFRIETNNSRRSFHSWKKGSIDDEVSCPNLKRLYIIRPNSISSLCSHQLQQTSITEGIRLWKIEKLDVSISGQREVLIDDFPEMKTFVQQGIFVSTPSLKWVNYDDKKSEASLFSAPRNKKLVKALPMVRCYDSRKLQEDEVMAALKSVCSLIPHKYRPMMKPDIVLLENEESCLVA
uniref:Uncharacterized protein n=1 Tax=Solanum tuberosum TaxID=4113 RepID=M1C564_SOLTU